MTTLLANGNRLGVRREYLPVLVTLGLFLALFATGSILYPAFGSGQVFLDLFIDNGFPLVLVVGAGLGFLMGYVIHHFEIQPFIATLAGIFLARGLCFVISIDQISVKNPFFTEWAHTPIMLPADMHLMPSAVIAMAVLAAAFWSLHYTRFGRSVYAIGGNPQSALLMGLPVARTRIGAYMVSGTCSALGGVLFAFYTISASGLHAVGMELDAIAAVVIGGTLLTGGSGYVVGTVLGALLLGAIQTVIRFQGTLSSWWTRIAIGALLFAFILLQRTIGARKKR